MRDWRVFGGREQRGNQHRNRCKEQHPCLKPGRIAIELLHMIFEATEQKRSSQHEQRIGDDCAGNRSLDQHIFPGAQCRQRNQQFSQIPKRRIEQTADQVAGPGGDRFRSETEQRGQGNDSDDGEQEQKRVRLWLEQLRQQDNGNEDQQPQQRRMADILQQRLHGLSPSIATRAASRASAMQDLTWVNEEAST